MNFIFENILIIYILPLLLSGLFFADNFFKYNISYKVLRFSTLIVSTIQIIFALSLFYIYSFTAVENFDYTFKWISLGDMNVFLGLYLDKISVLFLMILAILNIFIQWTSSSYINEQNNKSLSFAIINIYNFLLIATVLSSNIIQTILCLSIIGALGYLLLTLEGNNLKISQKSQRYFFTNRLADLILLCGTIILVYFIINYPISEGVELLAYNNFSNIAADFYIYLSDSGFFSVCTLFLVGIVIKLAQFPFNFNAISCVKTILSPLFVCMFISMCVCGIYLLIRLMPLFELSEQIIISIVYIGILSVFTASLFVIFQKNKIKIQTYTISGLFGLILFLIGINTYTNENYSANLNINLSMLVLIYSIILGLGILFSKYSNRCNNKIFTELSKFIRKGAYIEHLFFWMIDSILEFFAIILKKIDKYIIKNIINCTGYLTKTFSYFVCLLQNGSVQSYISYSIIFIVLLLIIYIAFALLMGVYFK